MQLLREHFALRFIWMVLAMHVFNFSVDLPDGKSDAIPEDLSINEMESVAEIILEKAFDIADAVPEQDEPDHDDGALNLKKDFQFFYETQLELPKLLTVVFHPAMNYTAYTEPAYVSVYAEVCPQPPEA